MRHALSDAKGGTSLHLSIVGKNTVAGVTVILLLPACKLYRHSGWQCAT